jgi:hypothetical protein
VPVAFLELVLDVGVVVAAIGSTSVDNHTLELVETVFRLLEGFRVEMCAHVQLQRELKSLINLDSLEGVVVKIEAIEV